MSYSIGGEKDIPFVVQVYRDRIIIRVIILVFMIRRIIFFSTHRNNFRIILIIITISEENILVQSMLYTSDEFVQLAKMYPGYEFALTGLYKKFNRMGALSKFFNKVFSAHYRALFRFFIKEIQFYKQCVNDNALYFTHVYGIPLLSFFPSEHAISAKNMYQNYMDILDQASYILG